MVEITAITNAISLLTRLKEISASIRDAEFKSLLADLSLERAEVKIKMAGLMNDNLELQNRIKELKALRVIRVRNAENAAGKLRKASRMRFSANWVELDELINVHYVGSPN